MLTRHSRSMWVTSGSSATLTLPGLWKVCPLTRAK